MASRSKQEALAKEISELVEAKVPEIAGAISQPIQMRTNELIAGVGSDVAVLLYGPDRDPLSRWARQAALSRLLDSRRYAGSG